MPPTRDRLLAADGLRAWAMVGVVLIHTTAWAGGTFFADVGMLARYSVPLFVVLTGVLLTYRYPPERLQVGAFLRRRFSRTLVPWIAWLPVFLLFGWLVTGDPKQMTVDAVWTFTYWGGGHLWFLLLIPQLYVVFLFWPQRHAGIAAVVAMAVQTALCLWRLYGPFPGDVVQALVQWHGPVLFPFWVGYLGVGVWVGGLVRARGEPQGWHPRAALLALVACVATGALMLVRWNVDMSLQSGTDAFFLPQVPLFVGSLGVLLALTWTPLMRVSARTRRWTSAVSDNSLGVYILHPIFIWYAAVYVLHGLIGGPAPLAVVGVILQTAIGTVGGLLLARLIAATPLAVVLGGSRRPLGGPRRAAATGSAG